MKNGSPPESFFSLSLSPPTMRERAACKSASLVQPDRREQQQQQQKHALLMSFKLHHSQGTKNNMNSPVGDLIMSELLSCRWILFLSYLLLLVSVLIYPPAAETATSVPPQRGPVNTKGRTAAPVFAVASLPPVSLSLPL